MSTAPRRTPGRRPGGPDTRGEILTAARESFANQGFERTSIRGVARAAGVDPALVHHYFDGKQALFTEAMELPVDPTLLAQAAIGGPVEDMGARLLNTFLSVWDMPATRVRVTAILRAALASESIAHLMRDALTEIIFEPVAKALDRPDGRLRISLVAAHLFGLAMVRYVLELEPLASEDRSELVARVSPVLQNYLTG